MGAVGLVLTAWGTANASDTASVTADASESASADPSMSGGAPPDGGGGGSSTPQYTPTGVYTLTEGTATKTGTITATETDQSGVYVTGGDLTLDNVEIITSGNSSSGDESSFYGLNAGVLAQGGTIAMNSGSVTTSGSGANGVFAYGESVITVDGTSIDATGEYAHGIMASGGGTITATDLTVNTAGGSSAPIATDRGSGTITTYGGTYTSTGTNSPALYSTGVLTSSDGTFVATGSEAAVIEGANSITLNDCSLTSDAAGNRGVMIYQSMSGDAEGTEGTYTQTGGTLNDTATDSPMFYVTNSTGNFFLSGVSVDAASGVLLQAGANRWGTTGSNGGTANLTATDQSLAGDIVADEISVVTITLTSSSTLEGAIDAANTASATTLSLDETSTWTVTGNSYLTTLTGAIIGEDGSITNIVGNGNTVTYDADAEANSYLGGATYTLADGGTLVAE